MYIVVLGLFFPIFFQLAGGIYKSEDRYFSSMGKLLLLPIPFSVIFCYVSLVLLRKWSEVKESMVVLLFTIIAMLFTTVTLWVIKGGYDQSKLILLVQFILPMFALVVGQQFGSYPYAINILAKGSFLILFIIVPLQLTSTVTTGLYFLSPSIYVFSIYQHLQYTPVIFVCMFLIVAFSRESLPKLNRFIPILAFLMGAYAIFSASMLAIGLLIAGIFGNLFHQYIKKENYLAVINDLLMIAAGFVIVIAFSNLDLLRSKFGTSAQDANEVPKNMMERIFYWRFYVTGIFAGAESFVLGHTTPPDRNLYPSAHNYYLDFIYNFGIPALLPLIGLLSFTVLKIVQQLKFVWHKSQILCLVSIVLFILLIDNSFKVGLRQLYPGIISFFLWGVLLALLLRKTNTVAIK